MFFINHTDIGESSSVLIEIEGPLNSETAPDFDEYINKLVENNTIHLLIDMRNLSFISSEGIGAALMIQKSINEKNGLVVFYNLNYEISSLFKLLGFDKVFNIAADRADALNILDKHMELFPAGMKSDNARKIKNEFKFDPVDEPVLSENEIPMLKSLTPIEEEKMEFESFIIECIKCRSLIRVRESGEQLCPYCSAEFSVGDNKKAVFKIKEIHSKN